MKRVALCVVDGLGTETEQYEALVDRIIKRHTCVPISEVLFVTSNRSYANDRFTVRYVQKVSLADLNVLLFQTLHTLMEFELVMIVQLDGYPVNTELWSEQYLDYDYIGAPWPAAMEWCDGAPLVGNGGFSIRSRRLYEVTSHCIDYRALFAKHGIYEDVFMCSRRYARNMLEQNGIRFAPVELARKFSIELPISSDHALDCCFGFHGKERLKEVMGQ